MKRLKFSILFLLLFLSGCNTETDKKIDSTSPYIYYKDEKLEENSYIYVDFGITLPQIAENFRFEDENIDSSKQVIDLSQIDTTLLGTYQITIEAADTFENTTVLHTYVVIEDTTSPILSFTDEAIYTGMSIVDFIRMFSVSDNYDGEIPLTLDNFDLSNIDFNTAGEKSVTVSVSDSSLNVITQVITFEVLKKEFVRISKEEDIDDYVIYYINESNIPPYYDYHIAAKAIQGIVNRNQPNLMIVDLNNPFYTYTDSLWKDYIESNNYTFIELTSFDEIAVTFASYFSDIIAINDEYKSYNNWVSSDADFGAMITAVTTYMPVPEGSVSRIESLTDLTLVHSFVLNDILLSGTISDNFDFYEIANAQEGYGFLFDNFKELFSTNAFMGLTSEAMDYAVSQAMMFFDLKPTYQEYDKELYQRICEYFDQNSVYFRVYGWVDQEGSGLDFVGRYGGLINPVGTQNLSLYHVIDIGDYEFTQKSSFVSTYDPTKKYVTFLASEGDTFKAPMTFQQGAWLDQNRGNVPINWGVIGITVEEFPIIGKYVYETMTTNDYFFSGGTSSIGFADIDTQMPMDAVLAIANYNKAILALSDQAYVDTYNDLFMFGDTFNPTFTGDYLIASGYEGAFGINPWEQTGSIYMSDMLFYNRRNVFYPRRGSSSLVSLSGMTEESSNHYIQSETSDYWYLQTDLVRPVSIDVSIAFFTQENGDTYQLTIESGTLKLTKQIGSDEIVLASYSASTIGTHELIISVDGSNIYLDKTLITVYLDQTRIFHIEDETFSSGGFDFFSENTIPSTFTNVKGLHMSQSEEIYHKIINDPNDFIVGYYGVVFDNDFTLSQYHTEPGPGEVISLSPTDFYRIALLLEENYPGLYEIVNMDEFYTYLKESLIN